MRAVAARVFWWQSSVVHRVVFSARYPWRRRIRITVAVYRRWLITIVADFTGNILLARFVIRGETRSPGIWGVVEFGSAWAFLGTTTARRSIRLDKVAGDCAVCRRIILLIWWFAFDYGYRRNILQLFFVFSTFLLLFTLLCIVMIWF